MKSPITLAAYGAHRGDLVELDPDHPGFRDRIYRKRRNDIAAIALAYRSGDPVPEAPYTEEEHAVWETIWTTLEPLHATLVCRELQECAQDFSMDRTRIPQLWEVNERLKAVTGYRMEPVGGLVAARAFLSRLGRGVFRSTQYIRHHSRPLYTPEPDVVHELVGHAATLAQPSIAALNRCIGKAALVASESEMARIESVYWYTMEFGTVEEGGEVVAIGAGLLSSLEESQVDFEARTRSACGAAGRGGRGRPCA